jgi:hypothetical protein
VSAVSCPSATIYENAIHALQSPPPPCPPAAPPNPISPARISKLRTDPKPPPGHVFASVEALAARYGIPADLPPPPSLQPGSSASLPTPPEYHWRYSSSMTPGNGLPAARAKLPHPLPPEALGLLFDQSPHLVYPVRSQINKSRIATRNLNLKHPPCRTCTASCSTPPPSRDPKPWCAT